jgi:hypothetical protein
MEAPLSLFSGAGTGASARLTELSITKRLDVNLNPIRAKVSLGREC